MGRGRPKAKQTKVARKLKYFSPDTDYDALQRELAGTGHHDVDLADEPADDEPVDGGEYGPADADEDEDAGGRTRTTPSTRTTSTRPAEHRR